MSSALDVYNVVTMCEPEQMSDVQKVFEECFDSVELAFTTVQSEVPAVNISSKYIYVYTYMLDTYTHTYIHTVKYDALDTEILDSESSL